MEGRRPQGGTDPEQRDSVVMVLLASGLRGGLLLVPQEMVVAWVS